MAKLSRRQVASYIAKQIAADDHDALGQLAAYLIQNNLTSQADLYARDVKYYLIEQGVVGVEVESAVDIDSDLKQHMEDLIKSHYTVKTVAIHTTRSSELLGGIRLQTADSVLDTSVQSRLQKLRTIA